jgi:hypothetical protein
VTTDSEKAMAMPALDKSSYARLKMQKPAPFHIKLHIPKAEHAKPRKLEIQVA